MKGATPGRHSEPYWAPGGKLFREIFFPKYSPESYEGDVVGMTSLDNNWWSNLSTAVLCQSMYYQTSDLRPQIQIDHINSEMNTFNGALQDKAVQWYTHVLLKNYIKYSGDYQQAKNTYISQLCTSAWVTYKMKQYNDGTWNNPSWEEFHHWVKLSALGATDDEINKLINDLKSLGLRIFPDVDVGTWRRYFVWYSPNTIDHNDVDSEARPGELQEVYSPSMEGMGSFMKEENSFEFTANGQPGSQYRSLPSSSCFSSTTKVLMADGMLTEMQHVQIGDTVASHCGPRKVMFISSPKRNGRTLYSINHTDAWFTATHPFINADCNSSNQPYYLAQSPLQLAHAIPTLSTKGVGHLRVGSCLMHPKGKVEVYSIEAQEAIGEEELLYDLILEPDCTGEFEYFVGGKDMQFGVASELPSFSMATITEKVTCAILMDAIHASLKPLESMHNSMGSYLFGRKLNSIVNQISSGLLSYAKHHSTSMLSAQKFKHVDSNFAEYLKEAAAMFVSLDGKYNYAAGEAFAHFSASRLFYQFSSMLDLGFRILSLVPNKDCRWIAISLLSIHTTTAITDLHLEPDITITVNQFPPINHSLRGNLAPFLWRVNEIFYIYCGNESKDGEYAVNIYIQSAAQKSEALHSFTHIVLPLHHGYRHYCIPVFYEKEELGFILMDVRMLSDTEVEEEKRAASKWMAEPNILPLSQRLSEYTNDKMSVLCSTNC